MTGSAEIFPIGASQAARLVRIPFAATLGLTWESGDDSVACVRLPWHGGVATPDGLRIDPLAVLALMDQACSGAVHLAVARHALHATIDLRCEFARPPDLGADVVCRATTQHIDDRIAIVKATAVSAQSGEVLGYGSAIFALGAHPGMAGRQVSPKEWGRPSVPSAAQRDFRETLGLQTSSGLVLLPFHERLIGAVSLPAMHGGASAAALALAAMSHADQTSDAGSPWEALSVTVHFLRAVQSRALVIRPAMRKTGSRSCAVGVSAFDEADPDREIVHAECLLKRGV